MLADARVDGFRATEGTHWFSVHEKAIFCLFRHFQDRSLRHQLIQHVKNDSKERVYEVFTDKKFDVKDFLNQFLVLTKMFGNTKFWFRLISVINN